MRRLEVMNESTFKIIKHEDIIFLVDRALGLCQDKFY
jgi:hypothetical protein